MPSRLSRLRPAASTRAHLPTHSVLPATCAAGGVTLAGDSCNSAARVSFPPRPHPAPESAAVLAALVRSSAGAAARRELATSGPEAGRFQLRDAVNGDGWL